MPCFISVPYCPIRALITNTLTMRTITQLRAFTSTASVNTFLSTANIEYVDLKIDADEYILIFKIEIK